MQHGQLKYMNPKMRGLKLKKWYILARGITTSGARNNGTGTVAFPITVMMPKLHSYHQTLVYNLSS